MSNLQPNLSLQICVIWHSFLIALVLGCCKRNFPANEGMPVADDPVSRSARGVYGITVASELSGFDPQTLRLYERRGLLTPARTEGGTRRYSDDDLKRLARISQLVGAGINLAGILQILTLEHRNTELESDNSQLKTENARLQSNEPADGRRTKSR
jgi:MerR family transcriptional regulator, heat shock protein HspR